MKLYCVKFKNSELEIIDVQHMFSNDNKEAHNRLEYFGYLTFMVVIRLNKIIKNSLTIK